MSANVIPVNGDAPSNAVVTATISITFAGLSTVTKQVVFALGHSAFPGAVILANGLETSANFVVSPTVTSNPVANSASTSADSSFLIVIVIGVVGGCMFMLIVAAVIYRLRRHQQALTNRRTLVFVISSSTSNLPAEGATQPQLQA